MAIVTLLTDFGWEDAYAGILHGVILRLNPLATIVDITHGIPPFDVHAAAYVLSTAYRFFPPDAIHVTVVDPGVGSERRPVAIRTECGTFVAPDNGALSYVLDHEPICAAVHLTNPRFWLPVLSSTFHGRDIFAPVAAHLSLGVALEDMGPVLSDPHRLPLPEVETSGNAIIGRVVHVDHYGNLVTDIPQQMLGERQLEIEIAGHRVCTLTRSFVGVSEGELLAYWGSGGHLELGIRNGRAADELAIRRYERVTLRIL